MLTYICGKFQVDPQGIDVSRDQVKPNPFLLCFDVSFCVSAIGELARDAAHRPFGGIKAGLYWPVATLAQKTFVQRKVPFIHSWQQDDYQKRSALLLNLIATMDGWINSSAHKLFEDANESVRSILWADGDDECEVQAIARWDLILKEMTPWRKIVDCSNLLEQVVCKPTKPFARTGQLGLDLGGMLSLMTGEQPDSQAHEISTVGHRIANALGHFPDEIRSRVLAYLPQSPSSNFDPNHYWAVVQTTRDAITAGVRLSAAETNMPPRQKKRTGKGEVPEWLGQALSLLKESDGANPDAWYALKVGINKSTLCRNSLWQKARKAFQRGRTSTVGDEVRKTARDSRITPQKLLRGERRLED